MYEALGIHHGPAIDTAAPFSDALHTVPSGMVSHGEGMGGNNAVPGARLPAAGDGRTKSGIED
jgi:hypothetical protein